MDSIFHSLHIGTLSTWLSVAGFGAVGVSVAPWPVPDPPTKDDREAVIELTPSDFLLQMVDTPSGDLAIDGEKELLTAESSTDDSPSPPELAPLEELTPLLEIPEIPDLPPPPPVKPQLQERPPEPTRQSSSRASSSRSSSSSSSSRGSSASSQSSRSVSGSSAGGSGSSTSRLAAGRMPAPRYPSSSKRKGETGSVTVSFTIGTNGKVISASVSKPSQHPALNEAAVRAVRRWRFPPGGVLKTQRRLDFVLK